MRTLILDIETSPNVAHVWSLFNQNISLDQLQEPSFTLCWAAKWRGSKRTFFFNYHDPEMLGAIWDLMNEADVVVHYNEIGRASWRESGHIGGEPPPCVQTSGERSGRSECLV